MVVSLLCIRPHLQNDEGRDPFFVVPNGWAIVESAQMPVFARLPRGYRFHEASLTVDGLPLSDVPVVVRRRWWQGKGVDLMATVDVSDMTPGWHTIQAILAPTSKSRSAVNSVKDERDYVLSGRFRLAPRPHKIKLSVVDQNGQERYGKVRFFDDIHPMDVGNSHDALSDPSRRDVPRTSLFVSPGGAIEFVESGDYKLMASGGIRDGVDVQELRISGDMDIELTVPRLIETPGELTADLHVHTAMSSDAFIPDSQRFVALAAADLDVAVITDHNTLRDPMPALEMLGLDKALDAITGVEFRIGPVGESIGHGNAFPLKPNVGAVKPGHRTPGEVFHAWRQHHKENPVDGEVVPLLVQLNHPRGIQFKPNKPHRSDAHALFDAVNFKPSRPLRKHKDRRVRKHYQSLEKRFISFDAIEVLNRFSVEGWHRVRRDWFDLLNRGYRITATGNSDSHTSELEPVGFPINLVRPTGQSRRAFVEAVHDGRVRVSSGPLVRLEVEHKQQVIWPSHELHRVDGPVKVTIRVEAVDWVDVEEVRLVVNGVIVFKQPVGAGPVDQAWTVDLDLDRDAWIVAEAGQSLQNDSRPEHGSVYAMVAPGHVPVGFTNPVWLDTDGDDRFQSLRSWEIEGIDNGPQ